MKFNGSHIMARPLRFEYPGAIFHVMARGDWGKVIFIEKE
jgi:hypothetical protein